MAVTAADPATIVPEPPGPAPDRAPDWVAAGTPEPLRSQLVAGLGADRVLTRALDLVRYASDASPYRLIPQAVAVPRDVDDMVTLMRCATELGVPLTFRAGGTSLNGQSQTDAHPRGRPPPLAPGARRGRRRAGARPAGRGPRARQPASGPPRPPPRPRPRQHERRVRRRGDRQQLRRDALRRRRRLLPHGERDDARARQRRRHRHRGARRGAHASPPAAPELAAGLADIRDRIRANADLAQRIARKFEIKNTTGYRLCAFLDADTPLEIFRRLVVGSEGTLAFVAEAVFDTVPLGRHTTLALVPFDDLDSAAGAVGELVDAGATATELMVAPTLIAAAWNMPGTPESVEGAAADRRGTAHRVPRRDPRRARPARGGGGCDPSRTSDRRR